MRVILDGLAFSPRTDPPRRSSGTGSLPQWLTPRHGGADA